MEAVKTCRMKRNKTINRCLLVRALRRLASAAAILAQASSRARLYGARSWSISPGPVPVPSLKRPRGAATSAPALAPGPVPSGSVLPSEALLSPCSPGRGGLHCGRKRKSGKQAQIKWRFFVASKKMKDLRQKKMSYLQHVCM